MFINKILIIVQLRNTLVLCSLAIGEQDLSQKGFHIRDYCPKIGVCEEGVHVMCLYYNPDRVMGPTCHSVVHLSITPDYAQIFLNVINKSYYFSKVHVLSHIWKERQREPCPGTLLFLLETLHVQLNAGLCLLENSSLKIRSRVAKGNIKGKDDILLPRGYGIYKVEWDEELATFAQLWANQCVLKSDLCHATKKFPDPGQTLGMIRFTIDDWKPINSPDFSNSTTLTADKVKYAILTVLEAWYNLKSYISEENIKRLDNRVNQFPYLVYGKVTHIGCGLSAYREYAYHNGKAEVNYNSIQIVCNFSSRAQKGTSVYNTDPPTQPGYTVKCGCPVGYDEDEDCLCYSSGRKLNTLNSKTYKDSSRYEPSVVVLPIFHVENAPEKKLSRITRKFPMDVRRRRFDVKPNKQHFNNERNHLVQNPNNFSKKYSIFSKPRTFELPLRRTKVLNKNRIQYKKDVAPRKDFTKAQRLALEYIENKRNFSFHIEKSTENPNNKVTNLPDYFNYTNKPLIEGNKRNNSERNLLNLLDKLELEIKNINFNRNNKDIFDRKIRKIYNVVIGKSNLFQNQGNSFAKTFNESDIVEKYDKILNNNHLYGENRLNFNKKMYQNEDYNRKINKNYKYRTTYINDTELKHNFDSRKSNRRITKEDLIRKDLSKRNDYFSLSNDRRVFYENKLLSLQRKIDLDKRNQYRHGVPVDRRLRPVRPTKITEGFPYRKAKKAIDTFYMPDRARFLHGF